MRIDLSDNYRKVHCVTVRVTGEALEEIERLPRVIVGRVLKVIHRLKDWPNVSGAKSLRGTLAGHWRVRRGDYRIIFHVKDDVVTVWRIGHRGDIYDRD